MLVINCRNVNGALENLVEAWKKLDICWRHVAPRGMLTYEITGVVATVYERPYERVLFNSARDANPFFHFFESLWILAGRNDVAFLKRFNSSIDKYSDDGTKFHAPYGYRLRHAQGIDQIAKVIEILSDDEDSRQAVMQIWDAKLDLGTFTMDLPCNDMIFFKIRECMLDMTVCCRSNDAIWGAYGANAVQFSTLQEFVACALGAGVGTYTQISDSFHIYANSEAWKRIVTSPLQSDPYNCGEVEAFDMLSGGIDGYELITEIERFCHDGSYEQSCPFIKSVAAPMNAVWEAWKRKDLYVGKHSRNGAIEEAIWLTRSIAATDWQRACKEWLERRLTSEE